MADQPIRIGFIGAGGICKQRHFPGLAQIDGVEVKTVCNRSPESSRRVADEWNIPETDSDWRRLIERDDLDAVFIGTWPYMHCEMATAALDAGKHVFCQARMASNLDEAQRMVAAADRHPELVHMVCPPPHRMPWEPYIQRVIRNGELGELREVRLYSVNGANLGETPTWREQVEYSGKQALQVGIWAETLIAWLGQYETLSASTATPIKCKTDENGKKYEIRIPQIVNITGTLANGAAIVEHHSGIAPHERDNSVAIYGSKGTLRVNVMQSIEQGAVGDELKAIDVPESEQRDWHVEEDFIQAIHDVRAGKSWSVSPDFHEALQYMKKVEAVAQSAEQARAVHLAEL